MVLLRKNLTMKLKPCPFCGSKNAEIVDGSYTVNGEKITTTNVLCGNCNAMGPDTRLGEDTATAKWNRRRTVRRSRSASLQNAQGQTQPPKI